MNIKIVISMAVFLVAYPSYRTFLIYNPDIAYNWITSKALPEGVVTVNYGTYMNDNLFHIGHYWEFTHNETGMHKLLKQIRAGDTYEDYTNSTNYKEYDAIWTLSGIEIALGKQIPKESIGRGYEIDTGSRDNWLLVNKAGTRSYYEFNQ